MKEKDIYVYLFYLMLLKALTLMILISFKFNDFGQNVKPVNIIIRTPFCGILYNQIVEHPQPLAQTE
jgi:hypothetical protein